MDRIRRRVVCARLCQKLSRFLHDVYSSIIILFVVSQEQCTLYWPTPEEPRITTGDMTVSRRGEAGSDDLRVREFVLHKVSGSCYHVGQVWT